MSNVRVEHIRVFLSFHNSQFLLQSKHVHVGKKLARCMNEITSFRSTRKDTTRKFSRSYRKTKYEKGFGRPVFFASVLGIGTRFL